MLFYIMSNTFYSEGGTCSRANGRARKTRWMRHPPAVPGRTGETFKMDVGHADSTSRIGGLGAVGGMRRRAEALERAAVALASGRVSAAFRKEGVPWALRRLDPTRTIQ